MIILHVTGKGPDGELQPYHIINPTNVVVNTGSVSKPGEMVDAQQKPIMVTEIKTFLHVNNQPLIVEETIEEVMGQLNGTD